MAVPGTVLFMGATAKRSFGSGSQANLWEVDLVFEERAVVDPVSGEPCGWNYFLRQDGQAGDPLFQKLLQVSSGIPIYQQNDLNQLFTLDSDAET